MFDIFKTLDLSFLGEAWKDCYLKFNALTIQEIDQFSGLQVDSQDPKKATQVILDVLKKKFVEGYGMKQGKREAVQASDLDQFPVDILNQVVTLFTEGLDKKKVSPSTTVSGA